MNVMLTSIRILTNVKLTDALNVFCRSKTFSISIKKSEKDKWYKVNECQDKACRHKIC